MALVATVREYHGLVGVTWLELRHGDSFAAEMQLLDDDSTPLDLSTFIVQIIMEHVMVDITQTAVTTLTSPGGIAVNNITPTDADDDVALDITVLDQTVNTNVGKLTFALPPTPLDNPDFSQAHSLPGAIVWVRLVKGDGVTSMPFAIFYRRGAVA